MKDSISSWIGKLLTVRSDDAELVRRGRLLGILLLGTLSATVVVSIVHGFDFVASGFSRAATVHLLTDLAVFAVLLGMLRLNQNGQTTLASYTALVLLIVGAPALEFGDLGRLALLYIIATGAASFFIQPRASFVSAALSGLGYTIAFITTHSTDYNYFLVVGLFMLALGTWLAATSLENALRQVHQRAEELDRRVTERTRDLTETLQREHAEAATTQAILKSVGDGVIVFDHAWHAVVVNPAACMIIERHETDVLGKSVVRIMGTAVSPDDQAIICSLIDCQGSTHTTLKIVWGNKTVSLSFAPIKLPSTNRRGAVVALRDVTREAEVDKMKSEFVSMVSHELRTPMTAIKGYVDLLSTGSAGDVTEMQRNFLSIIKTNTDRLNEMVAELLDLSHIEAGKMQMHYEAVTVGQIIHDVAAMLQKGFDDRDVYLRLDIPDTLPQVLSDPGRLAQIITNLLSNALKYTFEGRVDVTARLVGNDVQVDVTDSGIGMTERDQAQLFTRFFRASTARAREIPGTGLGLAITRSLIQMHGGRIWVQSVLGQGSTFSFALPALPSPLADMTPVAPSSAVSKSARPPKILIVEDELHIAQLFRHQLEMDGYAVSIATRGAEVLAKAQYERPDLISLDVMLPDINGFEVLRQLKTDPETKDIPVIITSIVADQEKGFALGATDYITKPLDKLQLLTSVRRILAQQDNQTRPSILVVEDDPDTRQSLSLALSIHGFSVTGVEDGAEALTAVAAQAPDLILLDLMMPRLDGWTVIRKLKENPQTASIPVIVLTGKPVDPQRDKTRIFGMGVRQVLTKPISVEMLVGEIRKQLPA